MDCFLAVDAFPALAAIHPDHQLAADGGEGVVLLSSAMAGDEELPAGQQVFTTDPITSAEAILPDHDRPTDRRGRVLWRRRGDQELATRRDVLAVDLGVVKDVIAHG